MTTLYRAGTAKLTPAVPYRAAQPAYIWLETVVTNLLAPSGGGWTYVPAIDGVTNQAGQWVHTGPGTGTTSTSVTTTYSHFVPAVPEQQAVPASRVDIPPQGWTAFAHTIATMPGNGTAVWQVSPSTVGAAVGFSTQRAPVAGYGHIPHGLLFTGQKVYNLRTGSLYTTYVATDVFTMSIVNGTVSYLKNGSTLGSEASTYAVEPMFLAAAMYGSGDAVTNALVTGTYGGSSARSLPALRGTAGSAQAYSTARLPALRGAGGAFQRSATTLRGLRTLAGDHPYGGSARHLPRLRAASYGGTLTVVAHNSSDTTLGILSGAAHMFTGSTGGAATTLAHLTAIGANKTYGTSATRLPHLFGLGYNEMAGTASMFETLSSALPLTVEQVLLVTMMDGVQVGSTMVPGIVLDAAMNDLIAGQTTMYTSQLLDVIMNSVINSGAFLGQPTDSATTWVVNTNTSGSTTYSNYPFNSYAKIGDRYFGACEAGVALLEGDTDNLDLIRASINLGVLDFGTQTKKTVQQCYIGMSAAGNLFVKITAEGEEYVYQTRDFAAALQQQRVTFGRGLRTNYVELEIYNEDGCDFEIDTVIFQVADLTRKI